MQRRWPFLWSVLILMTLTLIAPAGCGVLTVAPRAELIWADEFEGAAGSSPDPLRWTFNEGGTGWGNQELQYYSSATDNVARDGEGHLIITAQRDQQDRECWYGPCEFSSSRITTAGKFSFTYGRAEIRLKLPRGQGLWPAFWMLGDTIDEVGWPASGEIDVLEFLGHEPSVVHGAVHAPDLNEVHDYSLDDESGWHTFAVDWRQHSLSWSVDGTTYATTELHGRGDPGQVFGSDFHLLLNMAVGGSWPGSPDATTEFPQQLVVDYVRVYRFTD